MVTNHYILDLILEKQKYLILLKIYQMAATRRLQKELQELRESGLKSFKNIVVDEQNILSWQGLIVPENPPYNKGAFKIEINYPGFYY